MPDCTKSQVRGLVSVDLGMGMTEQYFHLSHVSILLFSQLT